MFRPNIRRSHTLRRTLVSLTALSLLALSLGPASLLAANTRDIYFGSPGAGNGNLTFTPVTVGGNTYVELEIRNDGGQAVNFVKWAAGTYADGLAYNPAYPAPAPPSLGGSTVALLVPSGGCSPAGPTSVFCEVGSLAAGASRTYKIVLTPPAAEGTYSVWFTASWAEGWSTTGSNADYQFASGDVVVETADCDTPASNWFLPGQPVGLTVGDGTNCQNASVSSGAPGGTAGSFGSLGIDSTFVGCPAAYDCYGTTVSATVAEGQPVAGGVQWTVTWYGVKSLKGVIHFHDDYDAATNPDAYDVIPFSNKYECSTTLTTNCWISTEGSKGNADPWWFTAVFVTPDNGRAGGFI